MSVNHVVLPAAVTLVTAIVPASAQSQETLIAGRVIEARSGRLLEGVTVVHELDGRSVVTDTTGTFAFLLASPPGGAPTLSLSAPCFENRVFVHQSEDPRFWRSFSVPMRPDSAFASDPRCEGWFEVPRTLPDGQIVIPCGRGTMKASGRVLDHDGSPLSGVIVKPEGLDCGARTGREGDFLVTQLPEDSVVLRALTSECAYPAAVTPNSERMAQVVIAATPPRETEAMSILHGVGWMPARYEHFGCHAERQSAGWPGRGAQVPTPYEALELALRHPEAQPALRRAAERHGTIPLAFFYGDVDGEPPPAPWRYDLERDRMAGYVYVIVLAASPDDLTLQLAYVDLSERAGEWDGVRIHWIRGPGGWDAGTVLERWYPIPDAPEQPITPYVIELMAAAIDTVAAGLPPGTTLCLRLAGDPRVGERVPEPLFDALTATQRAVQLGDCPLWYDSAWATLVDSLDRAPSAVPPPGYVDAHYLIFGRPTFVGAEDARFDLTVIRAARGTPRSCSVRGRAGDMRATCSPRGFIPLAPTPSR